MNRTPVLLALTAALAVAPAALATGGGHHSPDTPKPDRPSYDAGKDHRGDKHKIGKHRDAPAPYLADACVVADADADGVDLVVIDANHHLRRALAGAETFTAGIDSSTVIRSARHGSAERSGKRFGRSADITALTAGDRVTVAIWDRRGTALADLRAAYAIVDHGGRRVCGTPPPQCEAPDPADPGTPPDEDSDL